MNWTKGCIYGSLALLLCYLGSAALHPGAVTQSALIRSLPWILIGMGLVALRVSSDERGSKTIFLIICLLGIYESILGMSQVFGLRSSNHTLFSLTGSFINPGPFGGFIAVCISCACASFMRHPKLDGIESWMSAITLALGIIVLPASMSRAAWFAFAMALLWSLCKFTHFPEFLRKRPATSLVLAVVCVLMGIGVFLMKRDSALGRVHMWKIEVMSIAHNPLSGSGTGRLLGAYGEAQHDFYFDRKDRIDPKEVQIAGCPDHGFNEYLGIGVESGLPALIVSILFVFCSIVTLSKRKSIFTSGLIAWSVFAFFSYPLSQAPSVWLILFLLAEAIGGENRSRRLNWAILACGIPMLLSGILLLKSPSRRQKLQEIDYRSTYMLAKNLYYRGNYERSLELLAKGSQTSSDPMFPLMSGRNHEELGHYSEAEACYMYAHYMVPCRIYPLLRLMRMQIRLGENDKALETGKTIISMPVNEKVLAMVKMRDETIHSVDSLVRIK